MFTGQSSYPRVPKGQGDSFRRVYRGGCFQVEVTGDPTSLRGLNKEAGWLQDRISPCSYGTTKNPGSFHLPANPPSMCQPYPLAGSPHRGKTAIVATSNTQMWQVSEEDNFNLHRTERASLILHFDTWGTGQAHSQTSWSRLQGGSLLWSTGLGTTYYQPALDDKGKFLGFLWWYSGSGDFPSVSVVKNLPTMQEMQETWVPSLSWEDSLEEGMATHSCILAWTIPWTEGPGRLQSMGRKESDTTEVTEHSTTQHSWWESASRCRGHGFNPWSGKIPQAVRWLTLCTKTTEPACPEKPWQWEARAP